MPKTDSFNLEELHLRWLSPGNGPILGQIVLIFLVALWSERKGWISKCTAYLLNWSTRLINVPSLSVLVGGVSNKSVCFHSWRLCALLRPDIKIRDKNVSQKVVKLILSSNSWQASKATVVREVLAVERFEGVKYSALFFIIAVCKYACHKKCCLKTTTKCSKKVRPAHSTCWARYLYLLDLSFN